MAKKKSQSKSITVDQQPPITIADRYAHLRKYQYKKGEATNTNQSPEVSIMEVMETMLLLEKDYKIKCHDPAGEISGEVIPKDQKDEVVRMTQLERLCQIWVNRSYEDFKYFRELILRREGKIGTLKGGEEEESPVNPIKSPVTPETPQGTFEGEVKGRITFPMGDKVVGE